MRGILSSVKGIKKANVPVAGFAAVLFFFDLFESTLGGGDLPLHLSLTVLCWGKMLE